MFPIIGIVIVLGAIAAGYTMEHGNFKVLLQPAELVIIFGAAVGTVVIANPPPTLIKIGKGLAGVFSGSKYTKALYLETLKMLYDLFALSRKAGMAKLEEEVDNPSKGVVFTKYKKFLQNHHALHFLCDTLRMVVTGGVEPMEIDTMMELDLEVHHRESAKPIAALSTMADALPGLGIVAAVLGVVLTMGALGGPKEAIGEKVAAALVGTFLGILLCYRRDQVAQVRGFADHQLRHPKDPEHPSNRRISVIVQYLTPPAEPPKAAGEPAKAAGEAHKAAGEAPKAPGH